MLKMPPISQWAKRLVGSNVPKSISKRKIQSRGVSNLKSSPKIWTSTRVGALGIAIGATAFAAGFTLNNKSSSPNPKHMHVGKMSPPKYATITEMEKALEEIRGAVSEDVISTNSEDLRIHGFSEWAPANIDTLPIAVIYPKSTEDVSKIAKICNKFRIPMTGYSGGSSLEGNFAVPHGGISIDFAFMDKVLEFHEEDMDIVVQPAVSWMKMNEDIEKSGLFFPVDPSPTAKIGGMVGTNCSGTNAVRYGTMKDWVLNLTVVLADGAVIKTRGRPRKSAAGYNLNGIFVGSEGTLGLVTEATLKLAVIPKEFSIAIATFPTVKNAALAGSAVIRAGVPVAALEILDEVQMAIVNKGGFTAPRKWMEVPTLFFKFSGTKASVADDIKKVQVITKFHNSETFEFAKDEKEQHLLWSARKQALWSLLSLRPEGTELWSTDVAVPLSRVAEIIDISKKEIAKLGLFSAVVGHLGDGNFHQAIMYHKTDPVETAKVAKHVNDMVTRALAMEGTCTGEHSIGLFQKEALLRELGVETVGVMKSIKQALDPYWLMNPGKIFDTPV